MPSPSTAPTASDRSRASARSRGRFFASLRRPSLLRQIAARPHLNPPLNPSDLPAHPCPAPVLSILFNRRNPPQLAHSSIVGYQQKDTVSGFNFVIPTFKAVNSGLIHIQDIKIANATDWADNIQVLDEGGATVAAYFYATAEQSGFETDGWVSEDFTGLADVTFATGQSILIDTASPAVLTFAGQVSTEDTVVETVPGFNFVGNNTPVAVNIQDFTIVGATDWADNIQILDEGGATVSAYFYATAEQSGFEADGWVSEDFTTLADVTFEPGQGILIDTADVATVTIPGVNL